jgi:raffinose/stachyose/melibiose transport system substrate-binding protein
LTVALTAVVALALGASDARPARSDQVTITMLVNTPPQPGYQLLIPNFERVYPNITVQATYAANNAAWYQLESTELAAGNAPDLLGTNPGCGTPVSVCVLAKAGDLAPLVQEPWLKWSLPLVNSLGKYGPGLYAFVPALAPAGMFTNDALFAKLGLKVPETFSQLLSVCKAAKADGTVAVLVNGGGTGTVNMISDIAAATVYGPDSRWTAELKAGTVSFVGSAGWHQALQRFIELKNAGCFEPGIAAVTSVAQEAAEFAQGTALMAMGNSSTKGQVDADAPQFPYSFHAFPGGTTAGQTQTYIQLGTALSVNAHSSPANQAAARAFIDFIARPAQNALYAQAQGSVTQREFLKQELPSFLEPMAPVLANHAYVLNPSLSWWNPNVLNALQQEAVGLLTGQTTVDQVLQAMDAAWKQGPG